MDTGPDLAIKDNLDASEVENIHDLFEETKNNSITVSNVTESMDLVKLDQLLLSYGASLAERSPTINMLLHYIEYVETLKMFQIPAERTG